MRQITYYSIILLLCVNLVSAQKPQIVNTIIKEENKHSFFVEQAELWWKEIEKDNKNEKAWYNYYRANRYAKMTYICEETKEENKNALWLTGSKYLKEADEIMELISENIPNTYTYYIFKKDGNPGDGERYKALLKAYELEPENPDTYDELVVYYATTGNPDKRREFNKMWYKTNDISPGILNYNYNVLKSMKKGGVILSFGDNDTFPVWMLQDALGIRQDITVLNVFLLGIEDYRNRVLGQLGFPEFIVSDPDSFNQDELIKHLFKFKPEEMALYVSTTSWKRFKEYNENLFLIGQVLEYSKENIDNIALLKNNFENNYQMDYVNNQFSYDISQSIVNRTNVNYLPGIIKLYQHYKLSGDTQKVEKYKKLGLAIAEKSDSGWRDKAIEIFK